VITSHGRSSLSALESVSDWSLRPQWRPLTLVALNNQQSYGSVLTRRSSRDHESRAIFVVGLGISLWLIPLASMAPANARDRLRRSSRDHESRAIFVISLGISLWLIPSASMLPLYARGTWQSTKLQRLRREMTARSRGLQSPRRGHAIRWHGPMVFR
jgi:hypothetical protein